MTQERDASKTRILVVDNDENVREDLCEILSGMGYRVSAPRGAGEALMEAARREVKAFRPHVAVVDLRLEDDDVDRPDGLRLLISLNPARCVIYSAYTDFDTTRTAFHDYQIVNVINKNEHPRELVQAVREAARGVCAVERGLQLDGSGLPYSLEEISQKVSAQDPALPGIPNLARDLLAILFPKENKLILKPVESGSAIAHPVMRGKTVVLKAQREDRLEVELVKFAPAENIDRERKNYDDFIRYNLGGYFRPTLESAAVFYELGGAVYTFLGYPDHGHTVKPMQTLAEAYLNSGQASCARLLEHFFITVWNGLYQRSEERAVSPFAAYDAIFKLSAKLARIENTGASLVLPGLPVELPDPYAWLRRNGPRLAWPEPLRYAITHGDLHAGNLLVDDALEHTWTIDFERTGYGPILRDFVELEVDFATRLVDAANPAPEDFWMLARALCHPAEADGL
ncbi:MAG: response regulator, partial [Chloroflexi bacterium]